MTRPQKLLMFASLALSIWMLYWAGQYVSLTNSRSYQQHLIQAEFEPIILPKEATGLMGEADFQMQIRDSQRTAAIDARQYSKQLIPKIQQAKIMLIDLPRWAVAGLMLTIITMLLITPLLRRQSLQKDGQKSE